MNRKMLVGIMVVVILVIVVTVLVLVVIGSNRKTKIEVAIPGETIREEKESGSYGEDLAVANQILCRAKSEKKAREIAEKIGGQLVSYMDGVGLIVIEESLDELMERLEEEGLDDLELYPNLNYSAFDMTTGF